MNVHTRLLSLTTLFAVVGCGAPDGDGRAGESDAGGGAAMSMASSISPQMLAAASAEAPKIKADAFCLVDADTGRVLASHRGWESRPVASTQKLLTALVVAEVGDLGRPVTIQAEDTRIGGSVLGLCEGEVITRGELLKGLLLVSGNDAALALARDVAGSVKTFAQMMNARAESAGATRSSFVNPHGLTQAGQRSNAKDMAIIAMAAYANPVIRRMVGTLEDVINSSLLTRTVRNTNELLGRLPGCTGMKTGLTPGAGICLVAAMEAHGRRVILVQLDSTRSDIYNDAARAMIWGVSTPQ
ncbi:MAG: D-alanyl-D-alanine carboxypeptidase [Verrucomicrobiaceae bacterium]|nr:D-alanyl-D-alanine carboxypeptidase [Verrucomicrobiaceae bacterium]